MSSGLSGLSGMRPTVKSKSNLGSSAGAKFDSAMQSDKTAQEYSNWKNYIAADDAADPEPDKYIAPKKNVTSPSKTFADSLRMQYKDYSDRTGSPR